MIRKRLSSSSCFAAISEALNYDTLFSSPSNLAKISCFF